MMTLQEIKNMERIRKAYGEKKAQADAAVQGQRRNAPRLSKADAETVENMLEKIRGYVEYTMNYNKEVERIKAEYEGRGENTPRSILINPGKYGISQYEHANREVLKLKKDINRVLSAYKRFSHKHPDIDTLGITSSVQVHNYSNVDSKVLKIEKTMEDLRSYGEEEVFQLKSRGADMKYLLNASNADFGIHSNSGN